MNNRTLRARVGAVLLVLALCLTVLPAAAASGSMQTVYLDSAEEFAAFAKSCSLDTWSQGKTFILRADISLSGVDFTPAASFGGTFEGRGHTISDFNLTENASPAGLFGTILPGGRVANLNVAGSVAAGGDKIACGGIAGENYGKIVCCTFTGMVQGDTQIGGIVGRNQASGQIVSCSFEGKVQGTTATGGIAGQNAGTIRHCTNTGSVNIDNIDSALSLSDVQIDTTLDLANLATTQTFLTTTATGGIAGRNTGLIAVCENTGTVGYEHVGYNVGGIAGVTSGYLLNNTNSGTIYGRKDVGGIAGQVEPYVAVTVSESTKQQLQNQLKELKTLTDQATADAGGAASDLGSQLAGMGTYLDSAANAANNLRATATIDAGALANGGVEMIPESIEVESTANALPIVRKEIAATKKKKAVERSSIDQRIDYRWIDLRTDENQLMFKAQSCFVNAMRQFLLERNFIEIHTPKLIAAASESGSEVFKVDYFDRNAYLAQSPQFYKQMAMAAGFERIFETGPVFRAEKSYTNKHSTEFSGFDLEFSYITSVKDVMKMEEELLTAGLKAVKENYGDQIKELFGQEVIVPTTPFPVVKLADLYKGLEEEFGYKVDESEKGDLTTEAERLSYEWVKKHYGHEFLFITDYSAEKRAFYHMRDENGVPKGYDLIWRGVEITTGAQREHRYEVLKKQAEEKGLAEDVKFYLEFFQYGCPPHGGFGLGIDRLTMLLCGLSIKDAEFLFRGPNRLTP